MKLRSIDLGRVILILGEHSLNAFFPNFVAELDIKTSFNNEHLKKANSSITVTEEGISILVNDLQSIKALSPIDTTEDGMIISASEKQSANVDSEIEATVEGIFISLRALQLLKAESPIKVRQGGNVNLVINIQPEKACLSIVVTDEGIEKSESEGQ